MNSPRFAISQLTAGSAGAGLAVIDGEARASYAALEHASNRVANGLGSLGLQHQDRVAFLGRNGLPCLEVLIGAAKAGLVPTLLNWRLSRRELDYVVRDSQAKVIFVTDEFASLLPDPLPPATQVIVVEGASASYPGWRDAQSDALAADLCAPDDVAVQIYTSGTTGRPKGAMLTHLGFVETIPDLSEVWQLDSSSVVLCVLPMFHIAGVGTALATLWRGGTLVIENDARPDITLADIAAHGGTNLVLASVMLRGLVEATERSDADLSTLRTVSYGAAPITQQVLEQAVARLECRMVQPYGLTETTGVVTILDAADHDGPVDDVPKAARLRSCGRARPGVELQVVDVDTHAPVAPGTAGEIWVRTPRLMKGYWNQPDATTEALLPDGWFRTGDLGALDEDGYLFLHDRLKDMIVSGGENVYPAEVEEVLLLHPAVAEAAVIGVPHDRWGETPKAVVVLIPGGEATERQLIELARDQLAHYKCPTAIEFVAVLPRNASGKVLRRVLREQQLTADNQR
ncbi:MAG: long-chain-fatty-acid--CoA ligase, partial [Actinomycetota bacterium]|nr:long-chain-fatty-acid--CoA ligase [Actinomycetota bacterium]